MGLFSWFQGSSKPDPKPANPNHTSQTETKEIPGMNGAIEVAGPAKSITVFEFGSVAATADKVTLAGYCPVSDEIDPCKWVIIPARDGDAPQVRIVF